MTIPLNKPTETVQKKWGGERWYTTNSYCFKEIRINAGCRCSLQYHKEKLETIYVVSGQATLEYDGESVIVSSGDCWTTPPGIVHRLTAISDLVIVEASTLQLDDVVRVQDDFNRPDGRIEEEHSNAKDKSI